MCMLSTIITDIEMETQLTQIRDQQKEVWNRFSPGWKKWDELTMEFLKPMADEIIRLLKPKDNDIVLDVASGTGEPGLTIATMLSGGKVVATLSSMSRSLMKPAISSIVFLVLAINESGMFDKKQKFLSR